MTIEEKEKSSDRYEVIIKKLIEFAVHNDDIDSILTLHDSIRLGFTSAASGIESRWTIVRAIFRSTRIEDEVKQSIFDKLFAQDTTDTKLKYKYIITAMRARGEDRVNILNSCINEKKSMTEVVYTMDGLIDISLPDEERARVVEVYSQNLVEVHNNKGVGVSRAFSSLRPRIDDLSDFELRVGAALDELKKQDDYARVKLSKLREEVQFVIKSRGI